VNFPISEYRPVIYKGLIIDDYLVHPSGEFLNLKPGYNNRVSRVHNRSGLSFRHRNGSKARDYLGIRIGPINKRGRRADCAVHHIIFETFPDMVHEPTPLVREFNLDDLNGEKKHIITETGKEICVSLSIDHVDRIPSNNQPFNLRLSTQIEQALNRGVYGDSSKYKGVSVNTARMGKLSWQVKCGFFAVGRDPDQVVPFRTARFYPHKTPNAEELAALKYNEFLLGNLTEVFGSRLGKQIYDEVAYKNVVMPNQQLTLNL
tara:strand:- start:42 stop:824 length:783 start_codon:yes stop_codon:yes gene_type:complete